MNIIAASVNDTDVYMSGWAMRNIVFVLYKDPPLFISPLQYLLSLFISFLHKGFLPWYDF